MRAHLHTAVIFQTVYYFFHAKGLSNFVLADLYADVYSLQFAMVSCYVSFIPII